MKRTWPRNETPPATYQVTFTPDTPNDTLHGLPANCYVDPNPPMGTALVAVLPAPQTHNQTLSYVLNVSAGGKGNVDIDVSLHYEG